MKGRRDIKVAIMQPVPLSDVSVLLKTDSHPPMMTALSLTTLNLWGLRIVSGSLGKLQIIGTVSDASFTLH